VGFFHPGRAFVNWIDQFREDFATAESVRGHSAGSIAVLRARAGRARRALWPAHGPLMARSQIAAAVSLRAAALRIRAPRPRSALGQVRSRLLPLRTR